MTKRKYIPKNLQIYHLKKSIRKELVAACFGSNIDPEAVMDSIDFDSYVDGKLEIDENRRIIVKFISQKFGMLGEDDSLIYESEIIEYEEKLKDFRETLRIEFNKNGYNLNEEQFESLLDSCVSLFPSEKFPVLQGRGNLKIENENPNCVSAFPPGKFVAPQGNTIIKSPEINRNISYIVSLLKPPAVKPPETPNILTEY